MHTDKRAVTLNTYVYSELYNSVHVCVFITQYGLFSTCMLSRIYNGHKLISSCLFAYRIQSSL